MNELGRLELIRESLVAVVNEMRARGPFTKTILGVTVVSDAVVISMFALCITLAHPLVSGGGFEAPGRAPL